jgi:tripartite-type tricarboxylate transporter receptor subunit TctC
LEITKFHVDNLNSVNTEMQIIADSTSRCQCHVYQGNPPAGGDVSTIIKGTLVYAVWATLTMTAAIAADKAQSEQKFPTRPVRMIVTSSIGGQGDNLARMIGQKMNESWGQAVVVDNRPGGGGTLAASAVAKAAADGHTLLLTNSIAISAALQTHLPYDALKDLAGVCQIGSGSGVLVVAPALGVKSLKDLITLAKAQPGKIIYGSAAVGGGAHLTGAQFIHAAGIKVITVAFKGPAEATIEVLAGRTHYTNQPLLATLPFIKDGRLVALAVSTPQRLPALPDVPAMAETLPEFRRNVVSTGLLAPAGTPRSILNQISKEVARIVNLPDIKDRLQAIAFVTATSTPEVYEKILREQIETISRVAKDAGLKVK